MLFVIRHRGQWALSALEGIELAKGEDRAAAAFRIRLDELLRAGVRAKSTHTPEGAAKNSFSA
jgi:hypothetical protein